MKATLVLSEEKRIVFQGDDGSVMELSANPRTKQMAHWQQAARIAGEVNITIHTKGGNLLLPGTQPRATPRLGCLWAAVLSALLFTAGAAAGMYHQEIIGAAVKFFAR